MASLRELSAGAAPLLLLDAASSRIQAAIVARDMDLRWACTDGVEAGEAVFKNVVELGIELGSVSGFIFCEGPGSILGIRTVASAIRTWNVVRERPVWTYQSLQVVAEASGDPSLAVIADARRNTWHLARAGQPLQRVATDALPTSPLAMPEGFRQWSTLSGRELPSPVGYRLDTLLPMVADLDLFQPCADPDAFLHEQPSFAMWTPEIHRA